MPDDYVKRSDVHKAFQPKYAPAINRTFAAMIDSVPAADVVEVVRCGECQHYNDKLEMYCDYVCTIRHYCDGSPIIVGKDDFCSSGRRKDGGQEE